MSQIVFLAACSQSKKTQDGECLSMRDIQAVELQGREAAWAKLARMRSWSHVAGEIYQGQYWSSVRDCLRVIEEGGIEPRLLIASAGFGLLAYQDRVPNYSATFQAGSPDGIVQDGVVMTDRLRAIEEWWRRINRRFSRSKQFKCIFDAVTDQTKVIISVLPPSYFAAVKSELGELKQLRPDIEFIVIGALRHAAFRDWEGVVPLETDLQHKLGGGRVSLAPRMLNDYLSSKRNLKMISAADCRSFFRRRMKQFGKTVKYDRQPLEDETVRKIIRQHLASGVTSYSPSLRALRSAGFACEMKRFRGIFEEEKQSA